MLCYALCGVSVWMWVSVSECMPVWLHSGAGEKVAWWIAMLVANVPRMIMGACRKKQKPQCNTPKISTILYITSNYLTSARQHTERVRESERERERKGGAAYRKRHFWFPSFFFTFFSVAASSRNSFISWRRRRQSKHHDMRWQAQSVYYGISCKFQRGKEGSIDGVRQDLNKSGNKNRSRKSFELLVSSSANYRVFCSQ